MKAVAIVSGGMDSVTLAYWLADKGYGLHLISCDYGQRHVKELHFAGLAAERLGATHQVIDVRCLRELGPASALTSSIAVPHGHYAEESMRQTVVANRNAIMLSLAYASAAAHGAKVVATAVHAGDHFIYPDCRPEFLTAFGRMERLSLGEIWDCPNLIAPFVRISKAEIVGIGHKLGVPFGDTWSCYEGLEIHCGRCGTCVERKEAFCLAGVQDPTVYKE